MKLKDQTRGKGSPNFAIEGSCGSSAIDLLYAGGRSDIEPVLERHHIYLIGSNGDPFGLCVGVFYFCVERGQYFVDFIGIVGFG